MCWTGPCIVILCHLSPVLAITSSCVDQRTWHPRIVQVNLYTTNYEKSIVGQSSLQMYIYTQDRVLIYSLVGSVSQSRDHHRLSSLLYAPSENYYINSQRGSCQRFQISTPTASLLLVRYSSSSPFPVIATKYIYYWWWYLMGSARRKPIGIRSKSLSSKMDR